jgi:regulator of protease activity HflC (stomatin/prohibitin superfamily)
MGTGAVVLIVVIVLLVVLLLWRSTLIVVQSQAALVQRLGRYHATMDSGLHLLIPFIDAVRARVDLRESPRELKPMPVITADNATVSIDTVVYLQVIDPKRAIYEITDYSVGVERLVMTSLRNVVGDITLDAALTSRERINALLQQHLDAATDKWGVKVNRIELRSIDPPPDVRAAMEKQMIAERTKRAAITQAEGEKQSVILRAEGDKQAIILAAEAARQARILEAQGESEAVVTVRRGQTEGLRQIAEVGFKPDQLLAVQGLETIRQTIGPTDKTVLLPTDLAGLAGLAGALGKVWQKAAGEPPPDMPPLL